MALLKQTTIRVRSFLLVLTSDHLTGATGAAPTVTISKNGAAFGAAAGAVAELTNGWYTVSFTTVDTGTLGDLAVHVTGTAADPSDWSDEVVVDIPGGAVASVTGSVGSVTGAVGSVTGAVGSVTGNVGGNVVGSVASVTNDVGITQAGADKVWSTVTRSLTDKVGFALSAAGIQAIWDALTTALTTVGSIGKLLVDNINATISSRSTYAGTDTAGTTTLLGRLTAGRSTNLDNLDATISSRSTYAGGAVASVTAQVDANVKQINGTTVNGNGSVATPWGP